MITCRSCGCSDFNACVYDDGVFAYTCHWTEEDLCSFCDAAERIRLHHPLGNVDTITTGGLL